MVQRHYPETPLLGVATAVWRGDKVLLVRRRAAPAAGLWAMAGGLVDLGETLGEAAKREVREETRLEIEAPTFVTTNEIILRDANDKVERHFVLAIHTAVSASGLAVAGDDAAAVGWFTLEEALALPLAGRTAKLLPRTRDALR
ncbi:NUDIX domain-containing protein [Rhizobiaceae bacterium]|nr:NUDIX domain-containing protein [Rhizobiaceae bacterium]